MTKNNKENTIIRKRKGGGRKCRACSVIWFREKRKRIKPKER